MVLAAGVASVDAVSDGIHAEGSDVTPPGTSVTLPWVVAQLVPSPELAWGSHDVIFGLRWQVTPLLYSFGVDSRLSPWRSFVVEPLVRTSGSVELFVSPEYLAATDAVERRFGFRVGVRAHFPLIERGDYLTASLGTSYVRFGFGDSVAYHAGAYVLFGVVGMEHSVVPGLDEARWIGTLNVRFF